MTLNDTIREYTQRLNQKNLLRTRRVSRTNHPDLIHGFELKDEHWLIGYGLDASDGTQRNLTYIKGIQPGD